MNLSLKLPAVFGTFKKTAPQIAAYKIVDYIETQHLSLGVALTRVDRQQLIAHLEERQQPVTPDLTIAQLHATFATSPCKRVRDFAVHAGAAAEDQTCVGDDAFSETEISGGGADWDTLIFAIGGYFKNVVLFSWIFCAVLAVIAAAPLLHALIASPGSEETWANSFPAAAVEARARAELLIESGMVSGLLLLAAFLGFVRSLATSLVPRAFRNGG